MKKFLSVMLLLLMLTTSANAENRMRYAYIDSVDGSLITVIDSIGNIFQFDTDRIMYYKGDILLLLFADNDTPFDYTDDELVDYMWSGKCAQEDHLFYETIFCD